MTTDYLKQRYRALAQTNAALETEGWRLLGHYHFYRLALATILFSLAAAELTLNLPARHSLLFATVSVAIAFAALVGLIAIRRRWLPLYLQAHLTFLLDIALLGILVFTRSDLLAILAVPLMITVGGASLMFPQRVALAYAALCTLMVLFKQTLDLFALRSDASDYLTSGIVGLGFFTTALVVVYVAARARHSLVLVEQQQIDLSNMDQINRVVAENMDLGVMTIDDGGRIRLANRVAERQLGLRSGEDQLPQFLENLLRQTAPEAETLDRTHIDYNDRQLSIQTVSVSNGALLLIDDETLANQRMQQIRFASLGRMAGEVAHEIRNPLSAIHQAAQLLEDSSSASDENAQLLKIILSNTARIDTIIDSILDLNRAGAPRTATIPLHEILQQLIDHCTHAARKKKPDITLYGEDLSICFDPVHLEQVTTNLCQNALKHGKRGDSEPKIVLKTGFNEENRPFLDVIDDGPGVRPEQTQQLFEPFSSSDPKSSGLGLYISRRLCDMNHARLEYLTENSGHRFRITFQGENR